MTVLPTSTTLKKYGLTFPDWDDIFISQGCVCPICGKVPSTGRWVIDHFHIRGWKKMLPQERKKYVRGVLCWICNNRILTRGVTVEKLYRAAKYLEEHETIHS